MSKPKSDETEDFDIFALLELLLGNIILIAVITAAFVIAAIVYLQTVSQSYFVRVAYDINAISIEVDELCNSNLECIDDQTGDKVVARSDGSWSKYSNQNILSKTTNSPSTVEEYQRYFGDLEKQLSAEYLQQATTELELIEAELAKSFGQTNVVAEAVLRAERIVASINAGNPPVSFHDLTIRKAYPRPLFLVATAAFTGLLLGAIFVVLRDAFLKRR